VNALKAVLLTAVVAFGLGFAVAKWRCESAKDAAVQAWEQAVEQAERDASDAHGRALVESKLRRRLEQKRTADSTAHARERARLSALRVPVDVVVAAGVPDTCKAVVGALVEQVAVRDSIIETDSVGYLAQYAAYDRINASLGRELVAARVQWQAWEHLAKVAPVRPAKRLVLTASALKGMNGVPDEARAGARLRITGPVWAAGEYVTASGSAPGYRVGVAIEVGAL
jgi:hypothetical protein